MKIDKPVYYPLLSNYEKIHRIFGLDFLETSKNDQLSVDEFLEANDILSREMYGNTIASYIKERNVDALDKLYYNLLSTMPNKLSMNSLNFDDIGMILLRPETLGKKQDYIDFLKSLKLQVVLEKKFKICFEQYWILYHHGLKHENSVLDFPTRTFNYIKNDVCLLVLTGDKEKLDVSTISDYLFMYKGKHGTYTPNTLRGDIAFNALKQYLVNDYTFIKDANIPLDPIGAYRMLTRNKIDSDGCHQTDDIPLLFYAAQAVHIPNRYEIQKDLNVLCDDEDFEKIAVKIKKR